MTLLFPGGKSQGSHPLYETLIPIDELLISPNWDSLNTCLYILNIAYKATQS